MPWQDGGLGVHLTLDLGGAARFGPDVEWVDEIDYQVPRIQGCGLVNDTAQAAVGFTVCGVGQGLRSGAGGFMPALRGRWIRGEATHSTPQFGRTIPPSRTGA